jgi:hypothetical protein
MWLSYVSIRGGRTLVLVERVTREIRPGKEMTYRNSVV